MGYVPVGNAVQDSEEVSRYDESADNMAYAESMRDPSMMKFVWFWIKILIYVMLVVWGMNTYIFPKHVGYIMEVSNENTSGNK